MQTNNTQPTKPDLKSLTLPELASYLTTLGEKPYRAKQIYEWLHKNKPQTLRK